MFSIHSFSETIPIFFNRLQSDFSLSDRYKIFTSNWLWLEICENAVLSKIDITMTTLNKNFEIDKAEFSQWVPPNKTLKKHQILDLTFG